MCGLEPSAREEMATADVEVENTRAGLERGEKDTVLAHTEQE